MGFLWNKIWVRIFLSHPVLQETGVNVNSILSWGERVTRIMLEHQVQSSLPVHSSWFKLSLGISRQLVKSWQWTKVTSYC